MIFNIETKQFSICFSDQRMHDGKEKMNDPQKFSIDRKAENIMN